MPSRADFDALELRDWFGHLMVIDVVENGRDFRYRLYGTNIASALGADHTGRHVNTVPPERQIVRCSDYRRVCRAKQPCVGTRPCTVGRKLYRAQYLLLPLSTDGERVDKIIAAIYGGPIAARQIPL